MELCAPNLHQNTKAVRLELVEGQFFLPTPAEEERCFDKLSTNG